jgi:hypothetical protein
VTGLLFFKELKMLKVPLAERKTVVSQIMTTLRVRQQLELLARRENVSVGEIGRRALDAYLAKPVEQKEG